jgi:hypothetical protein
MSDVYQFADGHDNEAGFAAADPQPRSFGVKIPTTRYPVGGGFHRDGGRRTLWMYSSLTVAEFQALLAAFGLDAAQENECTIRTTEDDRTWSNYNGTIGKPEIDDRNWRDGFYKDVEFEIRDLEAT